MYFTPQQEISLMRNIICVLMARLGVKETAVTRDELADLDTHLHAQTNIEEQTVELKRHTIEECEAWHASKEGQAEERSSSPQDILDAAVRAIARDLGAEVIQVGSREQFLRMLDEDELGRQDPRVH